MSLISNLFVLFTAAAVLCYYLAPDRVKWIVLLLFSYAYYLAGGIRAAFFILFSTFVTWLFALLIERQRERGADAKILKRLTAAGLVLNFGMLGAVKYAGFLCENLNRLFSLQLPALRILFPLGISFYTFQSSGYLLDVYWGKSGAEKNPFRYALFVSFFPQLLQGPIGNYARLAPQLYAPHRPDLKKIGRGLERIVWGFAKKMIISDWAAVFVDAIWADPGRYAGICLPGLILYAIQLYADFSGAMDVVIGIGELFGITMDENFRQPYLAVSLTDFWKRWHITLGNWMKTYVFYPFSLSSLMRKFGRLTKQRFGRKLGRALPIAVADVVVFLLVGIWHGASWKFVIYGLVNGLILGFSELMKDRYAAMRKAVGISGKEKWYHVFMIVRTFFLVTFCFVLDRSEDLSKAALIVRNAFSTPDPALFGTISAGRGGAAFAPWALLIIAAGCVVMVLAGLIRERGVDLRERIAALPLPATVLLWALLLICIGLFGSTAAPRGFIYAQF